MNEFRLQGMESDPSIQGEKEDETQTVQQEPAKVVLFNDEVHTFDEVITQIIKATRCDLSRAEALTWEVHTTGRAIVFSGELARCMEVSSILEEIDLMTQIEF